MNAVFSILLLAAILGFIVFLLSKKDQNRRSQYGPSGLSSSAPTCRWTTASTGWTSTARTMSSPTSAAGRTTAASPST